MNHDTTGVALLGRILARLASEDTLTVAELARDLGAARATTFAVLRDLEAAGFVARDAMGRVSPGEAATALAYAAFGLGRLAGPALALLPVLRDETDGAVELVVQDAGADRVLTKRVPAHWRHARPAGDGTLLEQRVEGGPFPVALRLQLQGPLSKADRGRAHQALTAVAGALSQALKPSPCEQA